MITREKSTICDVNVELTAQPLFSVMSFKTLKKSFIPDSSSRVAKTSEVAIIRKIVNEAKNFIFLSIFLKLRKSKVLDSVICKKS